ncbi:sorting nexin-21 isoform X2 [Myotis myotis]|uniref:sorting nexin-21 isoform X2 n=1 Tax=Myotis myotis TaxID=51298 RepID=UPI00174EBE6F|nr:sorting nexin-21 isoform X2 [Myotis myotis]
MGFHRQMPQESESAGWELGVDWDRPGPRRRVGGLRRGCPRGLGLARAYPGFQVFPERRARIPGGSGPAGRGGGRKLRSGARSGWAPRSPAGSGRRPGGPRALGSGAPLSAPRGSEGCHGLAAPAPAAARPGQRGPRGGGRRPRGRAVPGELGAGGRRRRGPVLPPQRHPELHQRRGRRGRGRGGRRGGRPRPAAPRGPGVGRGRRTEPLSRWAAEQSAPGTAVAGFLEEVPEHPGAPAAALRGDQCQRGQGPPFQLYTLAVMGPGPPDHQPAHISRRYSDFERLHRNLQRQFRGPMAAISFPRKRLRRNFTAETIARRSRAFEQFLSHLQAVPELRHAPDLQDFFVLPELRRAQSLTCTGLYREALALWANAWQLQAQLGTLSSPDRPLLTLAGLAVCHQEMEDPGEARACCERALQLLGDKSPHPLLAPFLEAHVRLSWRLGLDKRQSEARLQVLQEAGLTPTPPPSLKELLIKEVLD